MRNNALLIFALAACNSPDETVEHVAPPVVAAVAPERVAAGVPHGGSVQHLAVTENGDAAVTVDNIGGLRLWPALDGKREPVPFDINGVEAVTISRAGDELLVGALDQAGAVHLVRFSRAGALRGKIQIPGEVAVDQMVAVDGGVLVMRVDESIERYDAAGKLRGRLTAEPSTAFGALAVRHGMAGVLLVSRVTQDLVQPAGRGHKRKPVAQPVVVTEHASAMRWIQLGELGEGLTWGATITLPADRDPRILAISPSHHRIAVMEPAVGTLEVLDVVAKPTVVEAVAPLTTQAMATVGFIDEDHVASAMSNSAQWFVAKSARQLGPSVKTERALREFVNDQSGAFADGLFVGGYGPMLLLENVEATRYLGWSDVATGNVIVSGLHIGLETTNTHVIWLDRNLQREGESEVIDLGYGSPNRVWWLDPNHAVFERTSSGMPYKTDVELVDFRHHDIKLSLGSYPYVQRIDYYEDMGMVAVLVEGEIHRFKIDLEYDKLTELPKLVDAMSMQMVRMVDPAKSGGVIAVGASYDEVGERVTTWRDDTTKTIHGKKTKAALAGGLVGIGPTGAMFVREADGTTIHDDGRPRFHLADQAIVDLAVTNRSGDRFAGIHASELMMFDGEGKQLWKQTIWGVQTAIFTTDGMRLVVRTTGGLVLLDAATGERITSACGFQFGIMTKTPVSNALNTRPVCEDSGA